MSLKSNLAITLQNRKAVKKIMDSLSPDQLNNVPPGFNNNIIWNAAHTLSIQQSLTYGLAGLELTIPKSQFLSFNIGTRPEKYYDLDFINTIKAQLFSTIEQLESDIANNKFDSINPFVTAIKFEINNIESAIAFNQFHEALHMGYILNIRRFL